MAVVGRASVLVAPTFSGFQRSVTKELAGAGAAGGQAASQGFGSSMAKWGKRGAIAAGATIAAGLTASLTKGFGRLVAIENAQAKMRGLGHDTATVDKIMKNALASVKGTAFGLGEAATTAAGAVAAGIGPGEDLERILKSVANSAAASGASMEEMGAIYNKAASQGKAGNDILGQVAERGIPVYAALAKQMGVTQEEVFKLATEGKVSFEEFERAMTSASGTVASEMGKTFTGSLANAWAALGRVGANLLSGIFDKLAPSLQAATGWIERMEPAAKRVGEAIGAWVEVGADHVAGFIRGLTGNIEVMDASARPKLELFGMGVRALIEAFRQGDVTSDGFIGVMERIGATAGKIWGELTGGIRAFVASWQYFDGEVTSSGFPGFMERMGFIARTVFEELRGGIIAFGAAWRYNDGEITSSGFPGFMERVGYAARQIWDALKQLDFTSFRGFLDSLKNLGGTAGSQLGTIGQSLVTLAPAAKEFTAQLPKIGGAVAKVAAVGLTVLTKALSFLADNVDTIIKFMPVLVAGYAAWRVSQMALQRGTMTMQAAQLAMTPVITLNNVLRLTAIRMENQQTRALVASTLAQQQNNAAQNTGIIAKTRYALATAAHRIQTIAATVATKAMTIAQRALNAVMRGNPLALVVTAIVLLVGALVVLYRNNETVRRVVDAAWAGIKSAIGSVVTWFTGTAWPWLRDAMTWIGDKATSLWSAAIRPAWDKIWDKVKAVGGWVKDTLWPWIRDAFANIADRATTLKDRATTAFDGIRSGISTAWDGAKRILDRFKDGLQSLRDKFSSVKDGIASVWGTIGGAIARPINEVIDTVNAFTQGLAEKLSQIPGVSISIPTIDHVSIPSAPKMNHGKGGATTGGVFAADGTHGLLSGYSPGRDNMHFFSPQHGWLHLAGGEPVMRPEFGAAVGRGWIDEMNYRAKHGGVNAVRSAMSLADGGVIGRGKGGTVGDALAGAGRWLWDLFGDPGKALRGLADQALSKIGDSWPAQIATGVIGDSMSKLASWVREKIFGGEDSEGGPAHSMGAPMAWPMIANLVKALIPGAQITSTFRPGAVTAGYGTRSLHALGRAVDFVSPNMVAATRMLSALRGWTELIHTPAGRAQQSFGRSFTNFAPITKAQHHDHVHVGAADGGVVPKPFIADAGVTLGRGLNFLDNRTGGPEPLGRLDQPLRLDDYTIARLAAAFRDGTGAALSQTARRSRYNDRRGAPAWA